MYLGDDTSKLVHAKGTGRASNSSRKPTTRPSESTATAMGTVTRALSHTSHSSPWLFSWPSKGNKAPTAHPERNPAHGLQISFSMTVRQFVKNRSDTSLSGTTVLAMMARPSIQSSPTGITVSLL